MADLIAEARRKQFFIGYFSTKDVLSMMPPIDDDSDGGGGGGGC